MYRCTNVQMYKFAKVTIYLRFAFVVTIFDIFKLIIDYEVDHQILSSAIWDFYNVIQQMKQCGQSFYTY